MIGDKVKYIGTGAAPYSRSTTWSTPVPSVAMASGVAAAAAATAVTTNIRKNENPVTTSNIRGPQYGASGSILSLHDSYE
jgi:hypothetical protein